MNSKTNKADEDEELKTRMIYTRQKGVFPVLHITNKVYFNFLDILTINFIKKLKLLVFTSSYKLNIEFAVRELYIHVRCKKASTFCCSLSEFCVLLYNFSDGPY